MFMNFTQSTELLLHKAIFPLALMLPFRDPLADMSLRLLKAYHLMHTRSTKKDA